MASCLWPAAHGLWPRLTACGLWLVACLSTGAWSRPCSRSPPSLRLCSCSSSCPMRSTSCGRTLRLAATLEVYLQGVCRNGGGRLVVVEQTMIIVLLFCRRLCSNSNYAWEWEGERERERERESIGREIERGRRRERRKRSRRARWGERDRN